MNITRVKSLRGTVRVPGDKSISHRGIMLGALAKGDTEIQGFLMGADCISSIECFKRMGVGIDTYSDTVIVHGKGLHGLRPPFGILLRTSLTNQESRSRPSAPS